MVGITRTAPNYRLHAEELHSIADGMTDTNNRKILLSIAEDYERIARSIDVIKASEEALAARNPV